MAPVYGLAECSVGLALQPPGRGPIIDRVQRERFVSTGQADPAFPGDAAALLFPSCGQPIPDHQIRIVDEQGRELPDRQEGRVEFKGPSATTGYYRNPEATRRLFPHGDDWLDSGDRGYLAGGDIYLTGRVKDLIIRGGPNLYPYELEQAAGEIPGIRKGCVAVFAAPIPQPGVNDWWWWLKREPRNRSRWSACASRFKASGGICWERRRMRWCWRRHTRY